MLIQEARIEIQSWATSDHVAAVLRSVTAGTPFVLSAVHEAGPGRHLSRFGLIRPELAVGFRSVIELQHRIDRELDIVSVDHCSTHFSTHLSISPSDTCPDALAEKELVLS